MGLKDERVFTGSKADFRAGWSVLIVCFTPSRITAVHQRLSNPPSMRRTQSDGVRLVVVGVCVHVVLLYAVFDVYYKSPLVHVARRYAATDESNDGAPSAPPAKRLVLFGVDGLRAQSFFCADGATRAPFLWDLMSSGRASYGVSRTRVPTESRPGFVAMTAGFYEDVSAVTRGWKDNPVDYDSLFNQSTSTWAWGSPSVINMFAKGGSSESHVYLNAYSLSNEDFEHGVDDLDASVFTSFQVFLKAVESNSSVSTLLHADRVFFFFHLLGMDMLGHGSKPHSANYLHGIRRVDQGVSDVVRSLDRFFGYDNRTAYVLTADHGMTDWGSHGAGTAHETLTPLVAWGAGVTDAANNSSQFQVVRRTKRSSAPCRRLTMPTTGVQRSDVEQVSFQISLAPLMASLIGASIPANSVGRLPIAYLKATPKYRFLAAHANYLQMLEQYRVPTYHRGDVLMNCNDAGTEFSDNEVFEEGSDLAVSIQRIWELLRYHD